MSAREEAEAWEAYDLARDAYFCADALPASLKPDAHVSREEEPLAA